MGNWTITIQGTGAHHNSDYPRDANRMAAAFVRDLKAAGHTVESATFTHPGRDDLQGSGYQGAEPQTALDQMHAPGHDGTQEA